MLYAGVDIGGTKCAVSLGETRSGTISVLSKERFETEEEKPWAMLERLAESLVHQLGERGLGETALAGIGISCGGPLSSRTGTILSPPNLPHWDAIPITGFFEERLGVKARLQNDANACALAEWKFGAGRGTENMAFLTFGTGLGAGLILDGRLYSGPDDMAGELGHIRLEENGPVGYGKAGSAEGFCSGGGIAQLGRQLVRKELDQGKRPALYERWGMDGITAKAIAGLADEGDAFCRRIYEISGRQLGRVLSILVDLLNVERIVIGSIFSRSRHLLWEACDEVMRRECLEINYRRCRVVPSQLGESLGDFAALSVAAERL